MVAVTLQLSVLRKFSILLCIGSLVTMSICNNRMPREANELSLRNSRPSHIPIGPSGKTDNVAKAYGDTNPESLHQDVETRVNTKNKTTRRIPNFLLAGAQKAGTTAIALYLFNQLENVVCHATSRPNLSYTTKESHFFDRYINQEGIDYYFDIYKQCNETVPIVLDATPDYLNLAPRVFETYTKHGLAKSLKIMFILREPVSREISLYQHLLREVLDNGSTEEYAQECVNQDGSIKTFEEFYDNNILPSIAVSEPSNFGLYAHWLKQWFELFPRQNILVTSYDDFKADQPDFLMRLHNFLEIPLPQMEELLQAPLANSEHSQSEKPIACDVQHRLAALYEKPNQELYDLLEEHPGPSMEKSTFTKFTFHCQDKPIGDEHVMSRPK